MKLVEIHGNYEDVTYENMERKKYVPVENLEVYRLAKELSEFGWKIYEKLSWQDKKIMGDQFISATDSAGANIVEGYRRFHYLDKIKFYYNSRASLAEANDHWSRLLFERKKISAEEYDTFHCIAEKLSLKLQNFISATYKCKEKEGK